MLGGFELLHRFLRFEVDEVDLLGWAAILAKYPGVEQVLRRRQDQIIGPGNRLFGEALLDRMLAGYQPNAEIFAAAQEIAQETGATVEAMTDPREAVSGADAVYTDAWASMGQENEADVRIPIFQPYQVNEKLMAKAAPHAVFMHCLPAHRGQEATDGVMDSPQSVVFDQAEGRLHVQKAILMLLLWGGASRFPVRKRSSISLR